MAAIVGLAAVLVALSHSAASAPSPSSVGSEISFLFQNDLDCESLSKSPHFELKVLRALGDATQRNDPRPQAKHQHCWSSCLLEAE